MISECFVLKTEKGFYYEEGGLVGFTSALWLASIFPNEHCANRAIDTYPEPLKEDITFTVKPVTITVED